MKKNIVVLEGADSSGKTTLAKAIGGDCYFHGLPFVGWVEEAHYGMLDAALKDQNKLVVIDRHWISEYIYGPIFRGRIAYADSSTKYFNDIIRKHGIYVLCVPSNAKEHELRFEREMPTKHEMFPKVAEIAEQYRRLANGDMHEHGTNVLQRYIRHGDFSLRDCLIYDLDLQGKSMTNFVRLIKEKLER